MFNIAEIREIIELIDQSSISEFSYEHNGAKMIVKKGNVQNNTVANQHGQAVVSEEVTQQQPITVSEEKIIMKDIPKQPANTEPVAEDENIVEITSPMVGTFYRKPSPDSDPYVEIGDQIEENTIVCIVEAMKLFNEIEAEVRGEIIDILVEDGELVEYGQPLFKVKTK